MALPAFPRFSPLIVAEKCPAGIAEQWQLINVTNEDLIVKVYADGTKTLHMMTDEELTLPSGDNDELKLGRGRGVIWEAI